MPASRARRSSDRERIEATVAAAEGRTAAEFVTAIARASGSYLYLPTLAAVAAVFALSGLALLVPWPFRVTVSEFYIGQVAVFVLFYLIFRWPPVRHRLVPRAAQRRGARVHAHQLFLDLGLASTRDRTGVLFFVSVAEHYVEIIADRGVRESVDDATWERTIADFAATVREGRIADAFVAAIENCTEVLAVHLPPRPGDTNELPNRLIEL